MKKNRREFLKLSGLAGMGLASAGLWKSYAAEQVEKDLDQISSQLASSHVQRFNMCGYAAPKLETVRIGFIGLGNRGPTHLEHASKMEGVEIKALCEIRPENLSAAKKLIANTSHNPTVYTGNKDEWKKLCDRKDIDLVYIATHWDAHIEMAVYAMNRGKHVAIEVPAVKTLEECWQLVKTSETTRKHCMMLENCCYDFFELLTLNMARQGFFGEIVHTEGAYIHDLRVEHNYKKNYYYDMWRLKENMKRNGNLYPTHGLGPICQIMNINRGDKMDYLTSVSSKDFMMGKEIKELAEKDDFYKPFISNTYRGNMNTTTIRTNRGGTIMLQHDVTSPRPYSRLHLVSGTKACAQKYPSPERISIGHDWVSPEEYKKLEEKFTPEIVKKVGEMAKQIGGHGGMDFIMNWRLIDCLRNGLPLDQDVYDAALWSAIAPLSEWSVANRSKPIDVPDFTYGSWKKNQPVNLSLEKGGTTKVKI